MFTNESDVVPSSGVEEIQVPFLRPVNTLAGDDIINGGNDGINDFTGEYSFVNIYGTLNTDSGNDRITGIFNQQNELGNFPFFFPHGITNIAPDPGEGGYATINTGDGNDTITGIFNGANYNSSWGHGIYNVRGIIDTGDGNDIITGIGKNYGIFTEVTTIDTGNGDDIITGISEVDTGIDSRVNTTINTGDGNDIITGTGDSGWGILLLSGVIDTGEGNDIITGTGDSGGLVFSTMDFSYVESHIDTGEGDDIITGTGSDAGIFNGGTVNTGNGKDSIISHGGFHNSTMLLGDGDDSIIADIDFPGRAIENFRIINTGYGNDIITSNSVIYNEGVIETGNGDDSIIVDGGVDRIGAGYGIHNNGGNINTGDGNDSIIANEGFESGSNSSGAWFLGDGDDYIKGFGSGDFYGGNGLDILELTPGTYTVGIWGEGGESPIFTKGNQLMITSEFEILLAGGTIYDFASLTAGQIIVVA
jgi:hypothetical protein